MFSGLKFDSRFIAVRVRAKNKTAAGEFSEPVIMETTGEDISEWWNSERHKHRMRQITLLLLLFKYLAIKSAHHMPHHRTPSKKKVEPTNLLKSHNAPLLFYRWEEVLAEHYNCLLLFLLQRTILTLTHWQPTPIWKFRVTRWPGSLRGSKVTTLDSEGKRIKAGEEIWFLK